MTNGYLLSVNQDYAQGHVTLSQQEQHSNKRMIKTEDQAKLYRTNLPLVVSELIFAVPGRLYVQLALAAVASTT
jgi:hypothetical protein